MWCQRTKDNDVAAAAAYTVNIGHMAIGYNAESLTRQRNICLKCNSAASTSSDIRPNQLEGQKFFDETVGVISEIHCSK